MFSSGISALQGDGGMLARELVVEFEWQASVF